MADFVDPFEDAKVSQSGEHSANRERTDTSDAVGADDRPSIGPLSTVEDARVAIEKVLVAQGKGVPTVPASEPSPPRRPSRASNNKVRKKQKVQTGDGRCRAYSPRGTRCKLCGKVHPL